MRSSLVPTLRRLFAEATALVWPRTCASCDAQVAADGPPMCAACYLDLSKMAGEPYCRTCGADRGAHLLLEGQCSPCRQHRPYFDEFVRVGRYADPLESLILRFKREIVLDELLGSLLADAVQGRTDPTGIDAWTPVPSHWWRRLRRGYQPTALLARAVVRRLGGRVEPLLRLTKNVPPFHHGMTASQRYETIRGAFAVRDPGRVAGRAIALIDDVTTTGATLREAARVLRKARPARLIGVVVAKTSPRQPATPEAQ